jgi:DNA-binding MarR family transcriptional regulator
MTTTVAKLLEQKRQLIERLQEDPSPEEREQIEQLLAKIDKALDLLDGAGAGGSD